MTHVSIIGTGNMGQAIAGVVTRGGGTVELLGPEDGATVPTGEVVVLAVPYPAVAAPVMTVRIEGRITAGTGTIALPTWQVNMEQ